MKNGLYILPLPEGEAADTRYQITVNGTPVAAYAARVSAMPFNSWWPGHQRPLSQTEIAPFISFDMTDPVEIAVTCDHEPGDVALRPLSREIHPTVEGRTVRFTLRKPGQFSLEIDGRHHNLHIFANPPENFGADAQAATYSYAPGVHDIGILSLHSGESVYIAPGAVVYGNLLIEDSKNVRIFGRGVLDGSRVKRINEQDAPGEVSLKSSGLIRVNRSENIEIDGVILRDPPYWTVTTINCVNVTIAGVKVIGLWRYNSDGFDFVNSQNVHVRHCFLRCFDDVIVFKGLRLKDRWCEWMNLQNHLVEHCVIWCGWGGALEMGAETVADEYCGMIYRDIDIIRNCDGGLRIHSGDRAEIHHVYYEDIRVEYSKYDRNMVLQESDDMTYEPGDTPSSPSVIRAWMYCGVWSKDNILGHVHDVAYKNIRVYKDPEVPEPDVVFLGADEAHRIERVTIDGYFMNGQRVAPKLRLNEFVKDVKIQ